MFIKEGDYNFIDGAFRSETEGFAHFLEGDAVLVGLCSLFETDPHPIILPSDISLLHFRWMEGRTTGGM
jgi:hypothetical protein